jgi:hypothetical protein
MRAHLGQIREDSQSPSTKRVPGKH